MECNICNGTEFVEYKTRGAIRCKNCGSIERNRLVALYLEKFVELRPGLKFLHFAPERTLFPRIAEILGPSYHVRDIDVKRYKGLKKGGISVEEFDLCSDCEALPGDYYDLIMHNHVMEHIPCNVTAVLWHLHRALAPDGLHMFSVPVVGKAYEESFVDMDPDERTEQFWQTTTCATSPPRICPTRSECCSISRISSNAASRISSARKRSGATISPKAAGGASTADAFSRCERAT